MIKQKINMITTGELNVFNSKKNNRIKIIKQMKKNN